MTGLGFQEAAQGVTERGFGAEDPDTGRAVLLRENYSTPSAAASWPREPGNSISLLSSCRETGHALECPQSIWLTSAHTDLWDADWRKRLTQNPILTVRAGTPRALKQLSRRGFGSSLEAEQSGRRRLLSGLPPLFLSTVTVK